MRISHKGRRAVQDRQNREAGQFSIPLRVRCVLAAIVGTLLVGFFVPIGCVSTAAMAPPVGPELLAVAKAHQTDAAALQRGRRIYLTKCTACHNVEPIGDYSAEEWLALLPEMVEETRLNASEAADLQGYLLTARAAWPVR